MKWGLFRKNQGRRSAPALTCRAVLLNVNEPESRGFALGLMTVLDDIGKGAGPFIVSLLITFFKA